MRNPYKKFGYSYKTITFVTDIRIFRVYLLSSFYIQEQFLGEGTALSVFPVLTPDQGHGNADIFGLEMGADYHKSKKGDCNAEGDD